MKYEILGVPQNKYKKGITVRIIICIATVIVAVIINVLLTVFRTDSTHIAFLILNIISDVTALGFVYFFISVSILPRKKLYKISLKPNGKISGKIIEVSQNTQTVNGLECYEIILQAECCKRVFLAKEGAVPANVSGNVVLTVADNIVISAEVLP